MTTVNVEVTGAYLPCRECEAPIVFPKPAGPLTLAGWSPDGQPPPAGHRLWITPHRSDCPAVCALCAHCGRPMGDHAGGTASVTDRRSLRAALCHPNAPDRPDCYRMVTVHRHPLRDCAMCQPAKETR